MSVVGYARVSTVDQNLEVQLQQLTEAGASKIFTEQKSGKDVRGRPALAECLEWIREGDVLVVTRLDRLGRSMLDLLQIMEKVQEKGAAFRCLGQSGIDTTTAEGRLMFGMLAAFAEFELFIRKERQMEGIAAAKVRGVYSQKRKTKVSPEDIVRLRSQDWGPKAICEKLGISRPTLYRLSPPGTWGPAPFVRASESP